MRRSWLAYLVVCMGLTGGSAHVAAALLGVSMSVFLLADQASAGELAPEDGKMPDRLSAVKPENAILIVPGAEADQEAVRKLSENAVQVFQKKGPGQVFTDKDVPEKELAAHDLIVFGTPKGNALIAKALSEMPFQVNDRGVVADKEYRGNAVLIAAWRNPWNPQRAMVVFTAPTVAPLPTVVAGLKTGLLQPIYDRPVQFIVTRPYRVLKAGCYRREGNGWVVSDLPGTATGLSRQQMLEDVTYLERVFHEILPTNVANRIHYGVDTEALLSDCRRRVDSVRSLSEFVDLLGGTMVATKGSHFWLAPSWYVAIYNQKLDYKLKLDEGGMRMADVYFTHFVINFVASRTDWTSLFGYFNGHYVTFKPLRVGAEAFPPGSELMTINGQRIETLEQRLQTTSSYWDPKRRVFYSPNAADCVNLVLDKTAADEDVTIEVQTPAGKVRACNATSFELPATPQPSSLQLLSEHAAFYLEKSKVLFVRLPSMDESKLPKLRTAIKQVALGKPLRAVVIDIRNNGGGSDGVWKDVLSGICGRSYSAPMRLAIKDNSWNRDLFSRQSCAAKWLPRMHPSTISFLENQEFLVFDGDDETIHPAEDSLKFRGKTYLLVGNVYSAAGSLVDFGRAQDDVISVGKTNPMMLGYGINPYLLVFPHCKALFTIEPVLDLTGCKKAEDVYHTTVEVPIETTLEEELAYRNPPPDISLEDFLMTRDPFFKKVMELVGKGERDASRSSASPTVHGP
jgi:hypothetical protein